jgi:NAD(P)-dependent dehydrogenase (short-subunit alcohol dehydrogenase family)
MTMVDMTRLDVEAGARNVQDATQPCGDDEHVSKPLTGKVAVVTGASRGIGRAIATRLAADGALVAVNYRSDDDAAATVVDQITRDGGEAFAIQADVASPDAIAGLFETLDRELSDRRNATQIDILVNNAGIGRAGGPSDTTEEDFDAVFATNVRGPFFVTQAALRRLRDGGRVIVISSGRSKRPVATTAAYCMAKASVNSYVVMLAADVGPRNITANTLAPGWTVTDASEQFLGDADSQRDIVELTALRRLGQPEDIAAVAAFLASDESQWVTGQYIEASGGFDLVPTK